MRLINLDKTEADVVLVGINVDGQRVHVAPLWECDIPRDKLPEIAAMYGLRWNEMDACGEMHVQIIDHRENPPTE